LRAVLEGLAKFVHELLPQGWTALLEHLERTLSSSLAGRNVRPQEPRATITGTRAMLISVRL